MALGSVDDEQVRPRGFARVVGAGVVGTTVEFFDFFLIGCLVLTVAGMLAVPETRRVRL